MILEILLVSCLFLCSILLHEFAHLLQATRYDKHSKIMYENHTLSTEFSDYLPRKQAISVFAAGIIAGIVPLLVILFITNLFVSLSLIIIYVYGCMIHDVKEIWRLRK
jgi:VIT1/CCC1 family predicted Fe2+/Mn2+ transporter